MWYHRLSHSHWLSFLHLLLHTNQVWIFSRTIHHCTFLPLVWLPPKWPTDLSWVFQRLKSFNGIRIMNFKTQLPQVAHMTKSEMEYLDWGLLGPLCLMLNQYFNNFLPEYYVLWFCLIWCTVDLGRYCSQVCLEICDHLNIHLFKIPYPPKPIMQSQSTNVNVHPHHHHHHPANGNSLQGGAAQQQRRTSRGNKNSK